MRFLVSFPLFFLFVIYFWSWKWRDTFARGCVVCRSGVSCFVVGTLLCAFLFRISFKLTMIASNDTHNVSVCLCLTTISGKQNILITSHIHSNTIRIRIVRVTLFYCDINFLYILRYRSLILYIIIFFDVNKIYKWQWELLILRVLCYLVKDFPSIALGGHIMWNGISSRAVSRAEFTHELSFSYLELNNVNYL